MSFRRSISLQFEKTPPDYLGVDKTLIKVNVCGLLYREETCRTVLCKNWGLRFMVLDYMLVSGLRDVQCNRSSGVRGVVSEQSSLLSKMKKTKERERWGVESLVFR